MFNKKINSRVNINKNRKIVIKLLFMFGERGIK